MPTFTTGNMWDAYPATDLFVITTNSFITAERFGHDERLVMGRGIALEARNRFPGIDNRLAKLIRSTSGHLGRLLPSSSTPQRTSPRSKSSKTGATQPTPP